MNFDRKTSKVLGVIRRSIATVRVWPDCVGGAHKGFCSWNQTPPAFLSNHAIATHVVNAYDVAMVLSTYLDALSALSPLVPLSLAAKHFYSTRRIEILRQPEENVGIYSHGYGVPRQSFYRFSFPCPEADCRAFWPHLQCASVFNHGPLTR